MTLQAIFYKAPGSIFDRLIRIVTRSPYSHVELVIDGVCWSSSQPDGGVRGKRFAIDPARWDTLHIQADAAAVAIWFAGHQGTPYDYLGALRCVIKWLPNSATKWFCSEACAAALRIDNSARMTPGELYDFLKTANQTPNLLRQP